MARALRRFALTLFQAKVVFKLAITAFCSLGTPQAVTPYGRRTLKQKH